MPNYPYLENKVILEGVGLFIPQIPITSVRADTLFTMIITTLCNLEMLALYFYVFFL